MEKNEELLKRIDCLDKGFVRLVDYMGSDDSIVQAARVSYGKGTKSVRADRELIRYLMRHRHTSPFEMVEFKFHVKLPIFVARQWIRHRTANVNEYSGRYSEMKDEFYIPDIDQIRTQNTVNRQGRSDATLPQNQAQEINEMLSNTQKQLFEEYKNMLDMDIARELARINLPLSTYTEWYWKIDLHNLLHFLKLRLDFHAQYEIRIYADKMAELIKPIVPLTYQAFEDYILESMTFSKQELGIIKKLLVQEFPDDDFLAQHEIKGLEATEFKEKLKKLLGID
ncbi:MAG: FAD-dependent thymidylate synthase [Ignavibacteria bacterium GWB2_35_12]|nr:MAG: FAD-dependent thymidylate synthase [Ignavibacteria bacterium GWA2_35_8]OGU39188.1 MAG: FAD-dependent thymidylate synthase [Ignavibacteria bacterium GWB2_35_12]OGU89216.1 MAG: FAD-dependent thymidylate synthase [Ignavibacteria bacterium RIFOXYA2_FULL_35_10]OGV21054.1 MAG: FAD-dependent thymidylate synthase [Ignavibacteria bacterium RIFOXYC2_FULL_35_21]